MNKSLRRSVTAVGLAGIGVLVMGFHTEAHQRQRFQATLQTTSRVVAAPAGRCDDDSGRAPVIGLLEVVGAGDATLLGPIFDQQSHCLRADGSFFRGTFRLTNDDGKTIRGNYFGNLEPTFNAVGGPPPGGIWLVRGWVCIKGGNIDNIVDDCAAGRYEPARGITNLSNGDGTILLDQPIGIR